MVLPKTFHLINDTYGQLIEDVEQFLLREGVQSNDNVSINYMHILDYTQNSPFGMAGKGHNQTTYFYKYHAIITIQFAEARFLDPSK